MESLSSQKVYSFEDFFLEFLVINLFKRKGMNSPLEFRFVKFTTIGLMILIILTLCMLIRLIQLLQESYTQLSELSALGEVITVFVIAICRGQVFMGHKGELNRLLHNLEDLFPTTLRDQLKYQLYSFARTTILKTNVMRTLCRISFVGYLGLPLAQSSFDWLIRGQKFVCRYPLVSWYPFDEQKLMWYPFVYCFQVVACGIATMFYYTEDLVFSTCVSQMSMQYQYLCRRVSEIDAKHECINPHQLKEVIRYQYKLEELRKDIEEIFSMSTFICFTILKIALCMFLFSIFYGTNIIGDVPLVCCVFVIVGSIYLRCRGGMDLCNASAGLIDSIYDHNWYEGTPKYRKMIIIMMIRANRPIMLSAGKMKHICMQYFKEIVVESYQIFMFLYNFSN